MADLVNTLEPGRYRVISVTPDYANESTPQYVNGSMCVLHAKRGNGASIYARPLGDPTVADVWDVSYRADGSCQILNVFAGKSIDVPNQTFQAGQKVQIHSDNDTRAQKWDLVEKRYAFDLDGNPCMIYKIAARTDNSLVIGMADEDGAKIYADNADAQAQQVFFMPIQELRSGATYELRPIANTDLCVAISGGSTANGASAILYSANHTADQQYALTQESDGWKIVNVNSRRALDVKGGAETAGEGTNIQQWWDNGTAAQRWNIQNYGESVVVEGVTCAVVTIGSYVTREGATYFMDVANALYSSRSNVQLGKSRGDATAQFALYPTDESDITIDVPDNPRLAGWPKSEGYRTMTMVERLYPVCDLDDSFASSYGQSLEWTYRRRYMDAETYLYGDWEEVQGWAPVSITEGFTPAGGGWSAWVTNGIPASFDTSVYRALEIEMSFRVAVSYADGSKRHGAPATALMHVYPRPNIVFKKCGFAPDGLYVEYQNDYDGLCTVRLDRITAKRTLRTKTLTFSNIDREGSIRINPKNLVRFPRDGESIRFDYRVASDLCDFSATTTVTLTCDYDAGWYATAEPEYQIGGGKTILATVQHNGTERGWLQVGSEITELKKNPELVGGRTQFIIDFPFNKKFYLWFSTVNEDGDIWGTYEDDMRGYKDLLKHVAPAHVFTWGENNVFVLECDTEKMSTVRSLTPDYAAHSLSRRARQTVSFGNTTPSTYRAQGILWENLTAYTVEDLLEMFEQKHVTYRSPSGEIANVALTGLEYETDYNFTRCVISMIEETV